LIITLFLGNARRKGFIMKKRLFTCRKCGYHNLWLEKCIRMTVFLHETPDGDFKEGAFALDPDDSGNIEYVCARCETVVKDKGYVLSTPEELSEYLCRKQKASPKNRKVKAKGTE
jgi:hypothetical protein